MRIGIRAHDVAYAPLEELIPNIHAQGFHCMHIAFAVRPDGRTYPPLF